MEPKLQKRVGGHCITDRLLGEGAFSKVFLAYGRQGEKQAVKVIPRQEIREKDMARFESQISLLQKCRNENIVRFLNVFKTESNFYLFLEYCEGGNLAEYIRHRKHLSEQEALKIFGQIVRGMDTMKALKIIHRDLKPANIMLKDSRAKIVDFGLARKYARGEMMTSFAGTPFNMAPEIIKGRLYDEKVDIYSAGTVLYEMLFGVCPFKGSDEADLLKMIERGEFKKGVEVNVSQKVQGLLRDMLQPEPEQRINLSEILDFLQTYEAQERQKRLRLYEQVSRRGLTGFGIFGNMLAAYQLPEARQSRVAEMDLRLYSKLCRKLSPQMAAA